MGSLDVAQRRQRLLHRMASPGGATFEDLLRSLPESCSDRTLRTDLKALGEQFPQRLTRTVQGRVHRYQFSGEPPRLLPRPVGHLDEDQITALIAARGILRLPHSETPTHEQPAQAYRGTLAQAIDRLLHEAGLTDEATRLAPDDLCVSRFGVADEDPAVFPTVLDVLQAGDSFRARYPDSRSGSLRPIHVRPIRMVSIAGEWFVFGWAPDELIPPGRIKQYRLSRLVEVVRTTSDPPACPVTGLRAQVTDILANAFRATGSAKPNDRVRVRMAGHPEALRFVEKRRWGAGQRLNLGPHSDLPPGWWRLEFTTAGITECRHWILGFGQAVRVESPPELVTWLREESLAQASHYGFKQV